MAEWTSADVIEIAPEFALLDPATLDRFVELAEPEVNPRVFGDSTKRAGALLTAHLLTLAQPAGSTGGTAGGAIASETVGAVSVTYAVPTAATSTLLGGSRHGLEFARLARLRACGPWVV